MTTNKDLSKPEHGTIQTQDVHDVKKELAADSTEKQNSFPPALITVQIIRTALELILVVLLLPLLSNPLVLILFRLLVCILFCRLWHGHGQRKQLGSFGLGELMFIAC